MRALRWVFAVIAVILFVVANFLFFAILVNGDDVMAPMLACSTAWWIFAGLAFWGFYSERQARQSQPSN